MKQSGPEKFTPLSVRLQNLPEEFSAFSDIYERELKPVLAEKELDRQKAVQKAKIITAIGIALGIAIAALSIFVFKIFFGIFFGIVAGVGLGIYAFSDVRKVMTHAKQAMIEPVAEKFDLIYNGDASETAEANLLASKEHKVVPGWDRKTLQDEIIGERNGIWFEFFEAHLEERRTTTDSKGRTKTTWVTVFRGQCWVINAPKRFHGTTRVSRDTGIFNALGAIGETFSRARLEDPEFEKAFEVYTTDQVEARFLLTPDVMQAFVDLENTFSGSKFRASFHDNRIYAALENGNMFEQGKMFSSLDDPNRMGDLLEDIATVFHLVDVLGKKI